MRSIMIYLSSMCAWHTRHSFTILEIDDPDNDAEILNLVAFGHVSA